MPENTRNEFYQGPYILDHPPEFHYKLLDYGERPYWSPDGKRIAFLESNYGDVCEIDMETRRVRNLTKNLGEHHSFLRVLYLANGDYLLIGPKVFKDRFTSRRVESELWVMDREAGRPPKPLGRRIFEGCGVSAVANRITYSMNGNHDPKIGGPDRFEVHVTDIVNGTDGPELANDRVIYRACGGHDPEPQDFRHNDTEVILAEYIGSYSKTPDHFKCVVKGVEIGTGEVRTYIDEPLTHNECEGIFPDQEHICLESSCDSPIGGPTIDLWKLKLDGSQRRVRMTRLFNSPPWRASNSNVSPDGKWLAFMVNVYTSEAGYGMGLGLLDLEAWGKSPYAREWETPRDRIGKRSRGEAGPA